ncbi:biliverdin-producing heme oxygenase [Antarcticibacterium flavum]|uniref:Biliverdin-producing heme oxygenase n=1 Tax=Antarcticibacterium flavum TaxID=2058175 RepID=A0A5B7X1U2_9FLAO|nr:MULTISPECIES: biliverdin-producing heme oxygenase [Antarcticibacterium]MCM4158720.1 heme oxygenase [Antarcticibacterium sp. W02-3]QCY68573.1 biliverdin-producing heme oxygenase [Antarcticibacterium flavum]
MLNKLREATEVLHKEIEKDNLAGLIISNKITLEEYKLLLLQNYIAYAVTEQEIALRLPSYDAVKFPQLEKDLILLNVIIPPLDGFKEKFTVKNEAEAYGAAYVVEGSALGGMLIAKELPNCPSLAAIEKHSFFNGNRQNINGWKEFCKNIKNRKFSSAEEEMAVQKARETFLFFSEIFNQVKLDLQV